MKSNSHKKQHAPLPSARQIRRTCNKELYRTIKKLKTWIPPEKLAEAEKIYFKKVILNLIWITENKDNRKKQVDWWEEACCHEIATLWNIPVEKLAKAFRESYGG